MQTWILPIAGLLYFVLYPPVIYGCLTWIAVFVLGALSVWMAPWYIAALYATVLLHSAWRSRSLCGILAVRAMPSPTVDLHAAKFAPHPELSKPNQMAFELQFVQDQLRTMPSAGGLVSVPPRYARYLRR
jgi:hypothetical protein